MDFVHRLRLLFGNTYRRIKNRHRINAIKIHGVYKSSKLKQLGNSYGGYKIAVEKLPDDPIALSFGIGEDLSFSEAVVRSGGEVYAFDPTPRTKQYVENHSLFHNHKFHFFSYGLSNVNGKQVFYFPQVKEYVSCSTHHQDWVGDDYCEVDMHTFDYIVDSIGVSQVDILKMDIEGSEFDVIDQVLSSDVNIRQIALEIHDYLFTDGTNQEKFEYITNLFYKNNYYPAYVSSSGNEITYVKK